MKEMKSKYLKITNETVRATQEALATYEHDVATGPRQLHRRAHATAQPTDRDGRTHHAQALHRRVLQGLIKEYREVELINWKEPDFDFQKIQSYCATSTWTSCRGTRREGLLFVARS